MLTPPSGSLLETTREKQHDLPPANGQALAALSKDIPVAVPRLPTVDRIEPYIREIDANHWYTNQGPLSERLQERLGAFWGVGGQNIALVSNATSGITLALQAQAIPPGLRCVMPSWTFVASAAAATAAGLVPYFVDVCPKTWIPDPAEVEALARAENVGAILIVVPFGAPIDLAVWDGVSQRTGCPVIIDAAAAFDTLRAGGPMSVGQATVVVSLHATKVFGLGEGGAVISRDPAMAEQVRIHARFGFAGSRSARVAGINAKMSEYTAAVGLAGLDVWPETRARWQAVTDSYRQFLPSSLKLPPAFGQGWVSATLTVIWPTNPQKPIDFLASQGVGTVSWWGVGCHMQPAYQAYPREKLSITEDYGQCSIGLPFWQDMSSDKIADVCRMLQDMLPADICEN
ncbi:MAG: DegT/DnrJ/EryC1/StrS family aminotransferase [Acetobacter sp.]